MQLFKSLCQSHPAFTNISKKISMEQEINSLNDRRNALAGYVISILLTSILLIELYCDLYNYIYLRYILYLHTYFCHCRMSYINGIHCVGGVRIQSGCRGCGPE